ncbi:MAG: hypothetical protein HC900_00210 [Methylacidiphilales bacterium]|nr:hypothetical protein [Candidatus Methylacidiphilales bacterium]
MGAPAAAYPFAVIGLPDDYGPLADVLMAAAAQAAIGKGRERHANGRAFLDQPIMENGRTFGLGFPIGQAAKKSREAFDMARRGEHDRAERELLGAVNYLAAAVLLIREIAAEDLKQPS